MLTLQVGRIDKMKNSRITAVFFDWDMTLARILGDVPTSQRLAALFQRHGLPYTAAQIESALHQYYLNGGKQSKQQKPQKPSEIIQFYHNLLAHLGQEEIPQNLGRQLYEGYALLPNLLYDDVLPTLTRLHTQGFRLGILSNHSKTARQAMESLVGYLIEPEHIIISEEINLHKPDGRIFHYAAEKIGVPPQECTLIGDNFDVDAIGSVTAGGFAHGFWLDRENKNARELPDFVSRVVRLDEVLDYLL